MAKKVAILMAEGFEPVELTAPADVLRRAGAEVTCVSVTPTALVEGAHGLILVPDANLDAVDLSDFDMLVVPGGSVGVQNLLGCEPLLQAIPAYAAGEGGRLLAAICAGPMVLDAAGVLEGRKVTCYPGCEEGFPEGAYQGVIGVVRDGNLVTASGPGQAIAFGLTLAEALCGKEAADEVASGMLLG